MKSVSKVDALLAYHEQGNEYKVELIENLMMILRFAIIVIAFYVVVDIYQYWID